MYKWILPSLSEVLADSQSTMGSCSSTKAQQQWRLCVAATQQLLLDTLTLDGDVTQGLVLAAPAPVFDDPKLTQKLQSIAFTAEPFNHLALMPFQMSDQEVAIAAEATIFNKSILPLLKTDPLAKEQFCLIFTKKFRLVLVLAEENGQKTFLFSFDSEVVQQAWRALSARVMLSNPDLFAELEETVQNYYPTAPDYRTVMQFSQLLLAELPEQEGTRDWGLGTREAIEGSLEQEQKAEMNSCYSASPNPDVEMLQAFAHEVRTPLTTIRTITRLLLKQRDLPANVIKRLKVIDRECTEQIDRMELLFRAAELETSATDKATSHQLTAMSLEQVLQASIPRWQEAASRRNLKLDVVLPQDLPTVVSNPTMLDRVLTGLIENFTRNLPAGSHIQVQVIPAGDQLKLQLLPLVGDNDAAFVSNCTPPIRKALGQLLMFQPETGTISLNLNATKHLFQAIGGKLIVRERPRYGEVLTVFLPLEGSEKQGNSKFKIQHSKV
ncbi:sensor histidine kinase [Fischerella thermalis]|uniref:histidine kinase n=2 Tax=Fischerella thermalis TaxID=372787 RepID=G6FWE3_9CYAN|nr:HAMP domain-containing sensor histidine kinase [Fischerella thermalis]EHC11550.1 histidine kinase [Fischerella thermalis JSC-11]PLZ11880.1 sensor histidine kinase [Fischerella thermalis WC119]PLZ15179.1 sensor histidine kinase [Fischerella thermalis WC114]PLZ15237.1 sensor histidine kinase [Fischerella thermalis WC1110]PLZ22959.1 sensor histidine kinase [Fischerella thermalis WC157]